MKVVIVDDDAVILRTLKILLSRQGHQVMTFGNPIEACSFLEQGRSLDVLILDYMMPWMTGDMVLRRIKSKLPQTCKVILISGNTKLIESLDLDGMGFTAFLPKPLDLDKLIMLVGSSATGKQQSSHDQENGK